VPLTGLNYVTGFAMGFYGGGTFVGNTITFNNPGLGYLLFGLNTETIVSAQMSLTGASAAIQASLTGTLKLSTLNRTVEGPISGAIVRIQ
jgi:hypothetical protein